MAEILRSLSEHCDRYERELNRDVCDIVRATKKVQRRTLVTTHPGVCLRIIKVNRAWSPFPVLVSLKTLSRQHC